MTDPTPKLPARSAFQHLRPGQVYETNQPYQDARGGEHPMGERWTFLGHEIPRTDPEVMLHVVTDALDRRVIYLLSVDDDPIMADLESYLQRVEFLSNDAELPCACEEANFRQAAAGTLFAMVCRTCDIGRLLARADEGATMLLLDEEGDTAMREALRLKDEGSWVEAAELAVGQPAGPAADIAWGALVVRPNLVEELRETLEGEEGREMYLSFRLIAAMNPVPEDLGRTLAGVVPRLDLPDRRGEAAEWFLQAAYAAAPYLWDISKLVVERDYQDERASYLRELHRAAQHAIWEARIDRDARTIVERAGRDAWSEIDTMLPKPPAYEGGGQSWVDRCERAGDLLREAGRSERAAQCYKLAIQQAEPSRRAITGGGAGLCWMDMIDRLEEKLAKMSG
jgi:hypothetical protein